DLQLEVDQLESGDVDNVETPVGDTVPEVPDSEDAPTEAPSSTATASSAGQPDELALKDEYMDVSGDSPEDGGDGDNEVSVNDLSVQLALAFGPEVKQEPTSDKEEEENHESQEDAPARGSSDGKVSKKKRVLTRRELLRNAAKARIRRMVTPKSKRTDLAVPQWVAAEWNKGTREKEQMAATLQEVNWDKAKFVDEMQRIITSRKKVSIKKDQGWYSEAEMKQDLKWSSNRITAAKNYCLDPSRSATCVRKNLYDNAVEYWVTIRADEAVKFEDGCFDRIKAAMPTGDAPMSDGSKPGAPNADVSPDQQNAEQNKLHLKRYLDSLLRLSTKLKTLRREMKDHYTPDHIAKLDREYDILNEEMAKGENAKFGPEPMWWKVAHKKMNDATFVFETQRSSRATAAEQKVKQAPQKSKQFFDKKDTEKIEEPGRITKKKKREQHENNVPDQACEASSKRLAMEFTT
ncbi:unnamed protein product, partial [Cladocopium goreaui]